MEQSVWTAVDNFVTETVVKPDKVFDEVLHACAAAELPAISVTPAQGKLLQLFAQAVGAKRILEIGTLGGYSTIWLARALPADGKLVTIEYDPKHAAVARRNLINAGVAERVDLREGKALDVLPKIEAEKLAPFDLFFIDADKPSGPDYFQWAKRLARSGSLIIVDNVVRNGMVIDATSTDTHVRGSRRLHEMVAADRSVSATTIQTVGSKGYDGFALIRVN